MVNRCQILKENGTLTPNYPQLQHYMKKTVIHAISKKVQVGNDQKKIHSKNRDGKNKLTIKYLYLENIS